MEKRPPVQGLNQIIEGFAQMGTDGANERCIIGDMMMDLNDVYGDDWREKEEDEIVCVGLNVNGLKKDMWKEKNDSLRNFMYQMKSDIIALQEVNLRWDMLPNNE